MKVIVKNQIFLTYLITITQVQIFTLHFLNIKHLEVKPLLTTFIQKGQAWEAEEGCNDDLAMCLVIFSWLATTDYFRELHDSDVRARMYMEQKEAIEADMAPFGFISDGMEDESFVDPEGQTWHNAETVGEYGDMSYMWEFR